MKKLALTFVATAALGLMGCGPGAKIGGGKQGAAEAFAAASNASKASAEQSSSPLTIGAALDWSCPKGGSASIEGVGINLNIGGGTASAGQAFNIKYSGCGAATSSAGTAVYNGEWEVVQNVVAATGTSVQASVNQKFKGRIRVEGAFDDFLEADVEQSIAVSALAGTGMVSMKLVGSVTNSSGTYSFNEDISVNSGQITADLSASKK